MIRHRACASRRARMPRAYPPFSTIRFAYKPREIKGVQLSGTQGGTKNPGPQKTQEGANDTRACFLWSARSRRAQWAATVEAGGRAAVAKLYMLAGTRKALRSFSFMPLVLLIVLLLLLPPPPPPPPPPPAAERVSHASHTSSEGHRSLRAHQATRTALICCPPSLADKADLAPQEPPL